MPACAMADDNTIEEEPIAESGAAIGVELKVKKWNIMMTSNIVSLLSVILLKDKVNKQIMMIGS